MKRRRITQSLGVAGLTFAVAAGALSPSALASPGEVDAAPVSLEVPTDDLERVRDIEGNRLHVLALEDEYQDEKTAAAVTVNDEAVLLRSLYAPEPGEPTSDAIESGLAGWVDGVNFFSDGRPQTDEETIRFSDIPAIDPATLELAFSTATSPSSFSAAWAGNDGVRYDVFRDGEFIEATSSGAFTDSNLAPDHDYVYTVRPSTGDLDGNEKTFQVHTLTDDAAEVARGSRDPIAALAMTPVASWFMYNTFITNQYIQWDAIQGSLGGCAGTLGDKYGGDNRGWYAPPLYVDPWSKAANRTGARMKIDFGPNYVTEQKTVGPTRLYTSSGTLKESRTASTSGIVFSERSVSPNLYRVKLSHAVGNPFCKSGAIRYTIYLSTWSSGVMQVNGSRHPVPAHEAYGLFMNSVGSEYWTTLYRGSQGDFGCLSGLCPVQTISKTHTPS